MGVNFTAPAPGCCGMAGAFGFEKDKYEISKAIGELELLPAVRQAPTDWLIVADGFSCREQIAQETDRHALHLAEVLQMALREATETPGRLPDVRSRAAALSRRRLGAAAPGGHRKVHEANWVWPWLASQLERRSCSRSLADARLCGAAALLSFAQLGRARRPSPHEPSPSEWR